MRQNFDLISTHIAVTYSTINDKTNLIKIRQMEKEELDDDNELAELRNGAWINMSIFKEDAKPAVDRGSGMLYDLDDATDIASLDTTTFMNPKRSKKAAIGLEQMMAQTYVQNDTSNEGNDEEEDEGEDNEDACNENENEEEDEGEDNKDAHMSEPDKFREEESPASRIIRGVVQVLDHAGASVHCRFGVFL